VFQSVEKADNAKCHTENSKNTKNMTNTEAATKLN
jgi:hypothetical protein